LFTKLTVKCGPAHLSSGTNAEYLSDTDFLGNATSPHFEVFNGNPNFTGVSSPDRATYVGFTGTGVAEDANINPDPIGFVDGWMAGVDHRQPFLSYGQRVLQL